MAFIVLLILTVLCKSLLVAGDNKWSCADYYWRDFFGEIPHDAVPAGNDYRGDRRYIGLVYVPDYEYLPATIFENGRYAQTTAYTFVFNVTLYVKILCSPNKTSLEWIPVESKNLHLFEDRNLIPGGSEIKESLYIGRKAVNGHTVIGKIFKHYMANRGIWYTPDGTNILNALSYEVLAYNCKGRPCPDENY